MVAISVPCISDALSRPLLCSLVDGKASVLQNGDILVPLTTGIVRNPQVVEI